MRVCSVCSSSDQSRREVSTVAASWGSGISSASQPKPANSRARPWLTLRARSSSSWSVKNWKGVRVPHSSPMKSMGV